MAPTRRTRTTKAEEPAKLAPSAKRGRGKQAAAAEEEPEPEPIPPAPAPAKATRGRGKKVAEPEHEEKEKEKEKEEIVIAEPEPPKPTRGRGRTKAAETVPDTIVVDSPVAKKTTTTGRSRKAEPEPGLEGKEPAEPAEPAKPAKRGRSRKADPDIKEPVAEEVIVAKPTRGRGRKAAESESKPEVEEEPVVVEEPAKPTRGRGRKAAEPEPLPEPAAEEPVEEAPKLKRGRGRKAAELEPEPERAIQEEEPVIEEIAVEEPPKPTRGRGRKAAAQKAAEPELELTAEEPVEESHKPTKGRGRKAAKAAEELAPPTEEPAEKAVVVDKPIKPTRSRGRAAKHVEELVAEEQPEEKAEGPESVVEEQPEKSSKTTRGRCHKAAAAQPNLEPEAQPETVPRGRSRRGKVAEPESAPEEAIEVQVEEVPKPKRGRGKTAKTAEPAELVPEQTEDVVMVEQPAEEIAPAPAPKLTRGRGRKVAVAEENPEPATEEQPADDQVIESVKPFVEAQREPPKRGRGRSKKDAEPEPESESAPQPESEPTEAEKPAPKPARRGRGRKDPTLVLEPTEEPAPVEKPVEEPVPEAVVQGQPEPPKPKRGHGRAAKVAECEPEPETMEADEPAQDPVPPLAEEKVPAKTKRGRGRAAKTKESTAEPAPAKPEAMDVDESDEESAPVDAIIEDAPAAVEEPAEEGAPKTKRGSRSKALSIPRSSSLRAAKSVSESIESEAVLGPKASNNRVTKSVARKVRGRKAATEEAEHEEQEHHEAQEKPAQEVREQNNEEPEAATVPAATPKKASRRRSLVASALKKGPTPRQSARKRARSSTPVEDDIVHTPHLERQSSVPKTEEEVQTGDEPVEELINEEGSAQELTEEPVEEPVEEPAKEPVDKPAAEATEDPIATEVEEDVVAADETEVPQDQQIETDELEETVTEVINDVITTETVVEEVVDNDVAPAEDQEMEDAPEAPETAEEETTEASQGVMEENNVTVEEPQLPELPQADTTRSPSPAPVIPSDPPFGEPTLPAPRKPFGRQSSPSLPEPMRSHQFSDKMDIDSPGPGPLNITPSRRAVSTGSPRSMNPQKLATPRRISSGISPTKSPIPVASSPIKVVEPEDSQLEDAPSSTFKTNPITPSKRRRTSSHGVSSGNQTPIDVSPALSLDPTVPQSSAVSPVKHSSPLVSSPVMLADHLLAIDKPERSMSPPSSPVKRHQARQSSPLKQSTPSGEQAKDFANLPSDDLPQSSPLGSPVKRSTPGRATASPVKFINFSATPQQPPVSATRRSPRSITKSTATPVTEANGEVKDEPILSTVKQTPGPTVFNGPIGFGTPVDATPQTSSPTTFAGFFATPHQPARTASEADSAKSEALSVQNTPTQQLEESEIYSPDISLHRLAASTPYGTPVAETPGTVSTKRQTPGTMQSPSKFVQRLAAPGSTARSSAVRPVSPRKAIANKIRLDAQKNTEIDDSFDDWFEGDSALTDIDSRIEGDSAMDSMVFLAGDDSMYIGSEMHPEELQGKVDESFTESESNPFEKTPGTVTAPKGNAGNDSWLHSSSKLRWSSPVREEESTLNDSEDPEDSMMQPDDSMEIHNHISPAKMQKAMSSPAKASPRPPTARASSPMKAAPHFASLQKNSPRPMLHDVSHYPTPNPSFETEQDNNNSILTTPMGSDHGALSAPGTITGFHEEKEESRLEAVTPNLSRKKSPENFFSSPPQQSPSKTTSPTMPAVDTDALFANIHMSPVRRGMSPKPSPLKVSGSTSVGFSFETEDEEFSEIMLPSMSQKSVLHSPPKKFLPQAQLGHGGQYIAPGKDVHYDEDEEEYEEEESDKQENHGDGAVFAPTPPPRGGSAPKQRNLFSSPPVLTKPTQPEPSPAEEPELPDFAMTSTPVRQPLRTAPRSAAKTPGSVWRSPGKSRLFMQQNAYSSSPETSSFSPVNLPTAVKNGAQTPVQSSPLKENVSTPKLASSAKAQTPRTAATPKVGTPKVASTPKLGTPKGALHDDSVMSEIEFPMELAQVEHIPSFEPQDESMQAAEDDPELSEAQATEEDLDAPADGDDDESVDQPLSRLSPISDSRINESPRDIPPRPSAPTPGRARQPMGDVVFSSSPFEENIPPQVPASSEPPSPTKAGKKRVRSVTPEAEKVAQPAPIAPMMATPRAASPSRKVSFTEDTVFESASNVGKIDFSFKPTGLSKNRRHTGTPGRKLATPKKSDTWFGRMGVSPAVTQKRQAKTAEAKDEEVEPEQKRVRKTPLFGTAGDESPKFAPALESPSSQLLVESAEATEAEAGGSGEDAMEEDEEEKEEEDEGSDDSMDDADDLLSDSDDDDEGPSAGEPQAGDNNASASEAPATDAPVENNQPEQGPVPSAAEGGNKDATMEDAPQEDKENSDEEEPYNPNSFSTSFLDSFLKKHEKKIKDTTATLGSPFMAAFSPVVKNETPAPAPAEPAPVAPVKPAPAIKEPEVPAKTDLLAPKSPPKTKSVSSRGKRALKGPGSRAAVALKAATIPSEPTVASRSTSEPPSRVPVFTPSVAAASKLPKPKGHIPVPKSRIARPIASAIPVPASSTVATVVANTVTSSPPTPKGGLFGTAVDLKKAAGHTPLPRARSSRIAAFNPGPSLTANNGLRRPGAISLAPGKAIPSSELRNLPWDSMPDRERKNITKAHTKLNCTPTTFPREIEQRPIPRPPSPSPQTQHKTAIDLRRQREEYFEQTGIYLGPGEQIGEDPKMLSPRKKGVRWNTPLEADYGSDGDLVERHSPTKARGKAPAKKVIRWKEGVKLDRYGNPEGVEGGPGALQVESSPVVIKKVLFKGERPE